MAQALLAERCALIVPRLGLIAKLKIVVSYYQVVMVRAREKSILGHHLLAFWALPPRAL